MTACSYLLRTPATASSSIGIWLISLEIRFALAAELIAATLIHASQKSIVLKSVLIVLRSLVSASLCEASELLITALTIKRSAASVLTLGSIIIIMIMVIRVFVSVCFVYLLVFQWVLSVTLRFSSTSGLLRLCPLNSGGISSSLSTKWMIWEYNPSTLAPVVTNGIAGVGGSHFHIICSRDFALSFTAAQSFHIIKCVCIIVGIVSMNFTILASSF